MASLFAPTGPYLFATPLERLRFVAWEECETLLARWLPCCVSRARFPDPAEYWRPGLRRFVLVDPWPARGDRWQGYVEWCESWNADGACVRGDDMISLAARLSGRSYRSAAQHLARALSLEAVT